MTTSFPKWPNGLVICASTLLCAAVVALQNAASYAERLETAMITLTTDAADALRKAGSISLAGGLNSAEKRGLAQLSQWVASEEPAELAQEPAEPEPEVTLAVEEEPAPEPPAAPEPEPAPTPEPEPAAAPVVSVVPAAPAEPAVVSAEPAVAPPVQPALVAVEDDEMAEEVDAQEEEEPVSVVQAAEPEPPSPLPVEEEAREMIPAATSRWWGALSASVSPDDSLERRFHANVPTAAIFRRKWRRPAPPTEVEPPRPEPQPAAPQPQPLAEPAAAVAAARVPAQLTQAPPMRYHIMMVGDSLMEDLGPRTHRAFSKRKGVEFVICAKFSTGLCRPEFFNWPAHMREQVAKRRPDLVIFFIGANDGLPIREGRRQVPLGGDAWREAYIRKMEEVVGIARSAGAEVIWVELPAVGGRYNRSLFETQRSQREFCQRSGTISLQTDPLFSGEWGKFEAYGEYHGKQVRLRRKDLTHLTNEGNMKVLEHLLPIVEGRMIDFYRAHPERRLTEEQAARIKLVPAVYTCKYTPPKKKTPAQPAPQPQGALPQPQ